MEGLAKDWRARNIEIAGRTFTIERSPSGDDYWLFGTKGARYRTYRNRLDPSLMYLVGYTRGIPRVDPLGPVVLTDVNGYLELAPN